MPVTLKKRKVKGKIALVLDKGTRGKGGRVTLKQWLYINPKTAEQKKHNAEAMLIAEQLRAKADVELLYQDTDMVAPHNLDTTLLEYFVEYAKAYTKADHRKVNAAIEHFKLFQGKGLIRMRDLNDNRVNDFKDYLLANVSQQTARAYFSKFVTMLKRAAIDKCCRYDVTKYGGSIPRGQGELTKEVLTTEEIQKLAKTPCGNETIKYAFIFSCFTGLDFADIYELQWKHINGDSFRKPREKTEMRGVRPLHPTAQAILGKMDLSTEFVFQEIPNRPKRSYSLNSCNKTIKHLVNKAGINKHITWHCARHSFGTNTEGDDGTIAALLGHAGTDMVKVYRRIKDERLKKAVNSLPEVEIS